MARQACRPGDVEIETFEFILLQSLAGQLRIIYAEQAFFAGAGVVRLRTDGPAGIREQRANPAKRDRLPVLGRIRHGRVRGM